MMTMFEPNVIVFVQPSDHTEIIGSVNGSF